MHQTPPEALSKLSQLSRLTQLQHLHLSGVPPGGAIGGLLSQLLRLTHLDLQLSDRHAWGRDPVRHDVVEQLQHLSSLTAMQQLCLVAPSMAAGHLSGIQCLSQLTGLKLHSKSLEHQQHQQLDLPDSTAAPVVG
jgi:hypothetical protein